MQKDQSISMIRKLMTVLRVLRVPMEPELSMAKVVFADTWVVGGRILEVP